MMRLDELFEVENGIASTDIEVLGRRESKTIPFIRPASTQNRTVAGWVKKDSVKATDIYPEGTLFVSTNGEGSHTYSYVSRFEFVPNSDVSVLIPKRDMTLQEKVFYAKCITMNRYLFSYGRKPKGERLKKVVLPDIIPDWVGKSHISTFDAIPGNSNLPDLHSSKWKLFRYDEVFEIKNGYYNKKPPKSLSTDDIRFIGATEKCNGVTGYVTFSDVSIYSRDGTIKSDEPLERKIFPGECITVSNNGSVGEAFYQDKQFTCSHDVNPLYLKDKSVPLTKWIGLFLCTVIRLDKYRWGYGRKWRPIRMPSSTIKLPVRLDGSPDFEFMEQYVKSFPCLSQTQ